MMVGAYARYVARHWPHPDDNPDANVETVKVYRLVHQLITPQQLAEGLNPDDETMDLPLYFMGEFGNPEKGEIARPERSVPVLPGCRSAARATEPSNPDERHPRRPSSSCRNYLEVHAAGRPADKEPQP